MKQSRTPFPPLRLSYREPVPHSHPRPTVKIRSRVLSVLPTLNSLRYHSIKTYFYKTTNSSFQNTTQTDGDVDRHWTSRESSPFERTQKWKRRSLCRKEQRVRVKLVCRKGSRDTCPMKKENQDSYVTLVVEENRGGVGLQSD